MTFPTFSLHMSWYFGVKEILEIKIKMTFRNTLNYPASAQIL